MLQRLLGETAEVGARSGPAASASQSHFVGREEVHTVDGRLHSQFTRLIPADVDEQAGVRGARRDND